MATVQERVLQLLEEQKRQPISGEDIAGKLGCTRAAVWKAVKALQSKGYEIEAVTNRGYTLNTSPDVLSQSVIEQILDGEDIGARLDIRKCVDSTNDCLKQMAREGIREDYILISEEQTAGKGRRGRSFYSPAGTGLYISFLLHPDFGVGEAAGLTTVAAVATARAIEAGSGYETGIKWVNDIWVRGKKVSGILTEASTSIEDGSLEYVIVGIGINLYEPEGGFPSEIREVAGAVCEPGFTGKIENLKNRVAAELIREFMRYYSAYPRRIYLEDYRSRCFVIGKEVSFLTPDHSALLNVPEAKRTALVLGVNDDCHLHVQYKDGTEDYLSSGEISIRF